MLTLYIEAQTLDQLRAQALAQLGIELSATTTVTVTVPTGSAGGGSGGSGRKKKADPAPATPAPGMNDAAAAAGSSSAGQSEDSGSAPVNAAVEGKAHDQAEPQPVKQADAAAPVDPSVPSLDDVRTAIMACIKRKGETTANAPTIQALFKKYGAKLVPDIKPEDRAAFIKDCNA